MAGGHRRGYSVVQGGGGAGGGVQGPPGEGQHQEHLDPDNDSSDQFIVIINLGKHYTGLDALNLSFCSAVPGQS